MLSGTKVTFDVLDFYNAGNLTFEIFHDNPLAIGIIFHNVTCETTITIDDMDCSFLYKASSKLFLISSLLSGSIDLGALPCSKKMVNCSKITSKTSSWHNPFKLDIIILSNFYKNDKLFRIDK